MQEKQSNERGTGRCTNFADKWQQVGRHMQTDDIIKLTVCASEKVPNVFIYNEKQLQDIRSFCFNNCQRLVLGLTKHKT